MSFSFYTVCDVQNGSRIFTDVHIACIRFHNKINQNVKFSLK